ncbi:hypothetical protein ACWE42_14645 [Sutcliffiella cohnii]
MPDKAINVCANQKCEWPIYEGDAVWKRGTDLFCHIKCLSEQMKEEAINE